MYPIAFGIVHGLSGRPPSVSAGGGPERSMPNSRRLVIDRGTASGEALPEPVDRLGRSLDRNGSGLAASADLHLELTGGEAPSPHRHPRRAPQELGVGELLPRT